MSALAAPLLQHMKPVSESPQVALLRGPHVRKDRKWNTNVYQQRQATPGFDVMLRFKRRRPLRCGVSVDVQPLIQIAVLESGRPQIDAPTSEYEHLVAYAGESQTQTHVNKPTASPRSRGFFVGATSERQPCLLA